MKILALDPANLTGFAHSDGHRGVWALTRPTDRHPGDRLARLRAYLLRASEEWGFERLAYEEATFGSRHIHTIALHNRLAGVIELTAHQLGAELWPVNPATLNNWATGYGRARDWQIIRAARTLLGVETDSPDVADACFVLEMAKQNVLPAATRRKQPRKVRDKMKRLFR